MDKLTANKSDIYGNMTWILQKIAGLEGQFAVNSVCGLRVIAPLREKRAQIAADPEYVLDVLREGGKRAKQKAEKKMGGRTEEMKRELEHIGPIIGASM